MIVLITYDLKQPGRNYSDLYETIKSLGDWQHPLESTWFVYMDDHADLNSVVDKLKASVAYQQQMNEDMQDKREHYESYLEQQAREQGLALPGETIFREAPGNG